MRFPCRRSSCDRKTVSLAKKYGVAVGAHPGYPDLIGFGRRMLEVTPEEAKDYILYQVGALKSFCQAADIELQHVKPHGQLYNMAWKDEALSRGIIEAIREIKPEPLFLALYNTIPYSMAQSMGVRVAGGILCRPRLCSRWDDLHQKGSRRNRSRGNR